MNRQYEIRPNRTISVSEKFTELSGYLQCRKVNV